MDELNAQETIRIEVQGADLVPIDELTPFQGDLKTLGKEEYERLRRNILDNGYSFTIHVWRDQGKNYIIDGHQRLTALKMMRDNEGYVIPLLPVSIVAAKDFASAKRKILAGVSQYGKLTEKSLFNFMQENEIVFDEIVATFVFPDVDMDKFSGLFDNLTNADKMLPAMAPPPDEADMKHGSASVKQVQLLFSAEDHAEFISLVTALTSIYDCDNFTDAVLEALREAHQIRSTQS